MAKQQACCLLQRNAASKDTLLPAYHRRWAAPKSACADLIDAVSLAILVPMGGAEHPADELNGCV